MIWKRPEKYIVVNVTVAPPFGRIRGGKQITGEKTNNYLVE